MFKYQISIEDQRGVHLCEVVTKNLDKRNVEAAILNEVNAGAMKGRKFKIGTMREMFRAACGRIKEDLRPEDEKMYTEYLGKCDDRTYQMKIKLVP